MAGSNEPAIRVIPAKPPRNDKIEGQVNTYLAGLQAGMEALKGTLPQTPEE